VAAGLRSPCFAPVSARTRRISNLLRLEGAVIPRYRLNRLVVLIALAALNFGAIRALYYDLRTGMNANRLDVFALGVLPMANVLAVGILIALWRRRSRPYLQGFLAFGSVALVLYLIVWTFFADEWVRFYVFLVLNPLRKVVGYLEPPVINSIFYSVAVVVLLGWPQLAFALIGGFLSRRFRKTEQPD
jgi:hypothetical protein